MNVFKYLKHLLFKKTKNSPVMPTVGNVVQPLSGYRQACCSCGDNYDRTTKYNNKYFCGFCYIRELRKRYVPVFQRKMQQDEYTCTIEHYFSLDGRAFFRVDLFNRTYPSSELKYISMQKKVSLDELAQIFPSIHSVVEAYNKGREFKNKQGNDRQKTAIVHNGDSDGVIEFSSSFFTLCDICLCQAEEHMNLGDKVYCDRCYLDYLASEHCFLFSFNLKKYYYFLTENGKIIKINYMHASDKGAVIPIARNQEYATFDEMHKELNNNYNCLRGGVYPNFTSDLSPEIKEELLNLNENNYHLFYKKSICNCCGKEFAIFGSKTSEFCSSNCMFKNVVERHKKNESFKQIEP